MIFSITFHVDLFFIDQPSMNVCIIFTNKKLPIFVFFLIKMLFLRFFIVFLGLDILKVAC